MSEVIRVDGLKHAFAILLLLSVSSRMLPACLAESGGDHEINYARGLGSELEDLCKGIQNTQQCYRAIERYQLARNPEGVVRAGATLTIVACSERPVVFQDNDDASGRGVGGVWYQYLEPLPVPGYHLVQVQYYEDQRFLLVNAATGAVLTLRSLPVLSPDSARFATGWRTTRGVLGPTEGMIEIWKFTQDGPKMEWTQETHGWQPESFDWRGNRRVYAAMRNYSSEERPRFLFRLRGGRWKAERPRHLRRTVDSSLSGTSLAKKTGQVLDRRVANVSGPAGGSCP